MVEIVEKHSETNEKKKSNFLLENLLRIKFLKSSEMYANPSLIEIGAKKNSSETFC